MNPHESFLHYWVEEGYITQAQLHRALQLQAEQGTPFLEALVHLNFLTHEKVRLGQERFPEWAQQKREILRSTRSLPLSHAWSAGEELSPWASSGEQASWAYPPESFNESFVSSLSPAAALSEANFLLSEADPLSAAPPGATLEDIPLPSELSRPFAPPSQSSNPADSWEEVLSSAQSHPSTPSRASNTEIWGEERKARGEKSQSPRPLQSPWDPSSSAFEEAGFRLEQDEVIIELNNPKPVHKRKPIVVVSKHSVGKTRQPKSRRENPSSQIVEEMSRPAGLAHEELSFAPSHESLASQALDASEWTEAKSPTREPLHSEHKFTPGAASEITTESVEASSPPAQRRPTHESWAPLPSKFEENSPFSASKAEGSFQPHPSVEPNPNGLPKSQTRSFPEASFLQQQAEPAIRSPFANLKGTLLLQRFLVGRPIASGPGFVSYNAIDREARRFVTVRFFPFYVFLRKQQLEVFLSECKVWQALSHSSLVTLIAYGVHNNAGAFFVHPPLEEHSFAFHLQHRATLTLGELFPLFDRLCQSLTLLHQNGIVHKNLQLTSLRWQKDTPQDFSNVQLFPAGLTPLSTSPLTLSWMAVLSSQNPLALCPELGDLPPDELTQAADIYALSALLFTTLTQKPLFSGHSPMHLLQQHKDALPPTLKESCPHVAYPEHLQALLNDGLAKAPHRRPRSSADWFHKLVQAIKDKPNQNVSLLAVKVQLDAKDHALWKQANQMLEQCYSHHSIPPMPQLPMFVALAKKLRHPSKEKESFAPGDFQPQATPNVSNHSHASSEQTRTSAPENLEKKEQPTSSSQRRFLLTGMLLLLLLLFVIVLAIKRGQ